MDRIGDYKSDNSPSVCQVFTTNAFRQKLINWNGWWRSEEADDEDHVKGRQCPDSLIKIWVEI